MPRPHRPIPPPSASLAGLLLAACLSPALGCASDEPFDDELLLEEDLEDEDAEALASSWPPPDELSASASPSAVDIPWQVSSFQNLSGETRYIKNSGSRGTKLYLSNQALSADDPTLGFNNANTFSDSCGPDAVYNVFHWYGIDDLESMSPYTLGNEMYTNEWGISFAGFYYELDGTKTNYLRNAFESIAEDHIPTSWTPRYKHSGSVDAMYGQIWTQLQRGNPVIVVYKSGTTKGHFSVIVGLEMAGQVGNINDDVLTMANIRLANAGDDRMTWGQFRQLWARDYYGPWGGPVLSLAGEEPYTWLHLEDTEDGSGSGGGTPGPAPDPDLPPIHQN